MIRISEVVFTRPVMESELPMDEEFREKIQDEVVAKAAEIFGGLDQISDITNTYHPSAGFGPFYNLVIKVFRKKAETDE